MNSMIPVFLALIGVIALMLAVVFVMKWLNNRISGTRPSGGLKIITSVGVGQDKAIMAVKAGKKNLLVGSSSGGINLICELDEEDMSLIQGSASSDANMAGKSFAECLKYNAAKLGGDFMRPYKKSGSDSGMPSDNDENIS